MKKEPPLQPQCFLSYFGLFKITSIYAAIFDLSYLHLGTQKSILGRLGASLGRLGPSWERLGSILGASWARLGPSWGRLGRILAHLCTSWRVLGRLGAVLAPFGPLKKTWLCNGTGSALI